MSDLLRGIRVLESATLLNGSTVGTMLGDLGADVIKVESPSRGDYIRNTAGEISPNNSPLHVQVNKHKRSIALDLRIPEQLEIFWLLLDTADVFVDGNTAGALDRLGIGYEAQKSRKSSIIYCQYSGFGSHGPYAVMPTHGQMMSALGGANPMFMESDGFMKRVPALPITCSAQRDARSGGEATSAGAIHAAYHVAAALFQRERTGQGAFIDVAGVDGVLAHAWVAATISLNEERITNRTNLAAAETDEVSWAKYQYYATVDDKVVLFGAIERKFWENFCRAIDRKDLLEEHDDAASAVDFADDSELRHVLQDIFRTRPSEEWVQLALEYDFPCSPAPRSIREAAEDPHVMSRTLFVDAPDPEGALFTYIGEAGQVAGQPYRVQRPAPRLGEHTEEILNELRIGSSLETDS
jgi:crotonobetainyl-CoA:carnitine CoA-transferase CaiB-like acyl-CoA transferase